MAMFNQKNPERSGEKARRIVREQSERISAIKDVQKREKQEPVKGLRTIFIEIYLEHGFKKAKEAINSGFYSDVILATWIGEDVLGYDPNTRILDAFRENSNKENAYAIANEINSEIGVELYTQDAVDSLIDKDRRRRRIGDDDAR